MYVTEKDWTKGRNIMFFFFITSKRTFKHISLIVILSLFTAW
ncbi:polysaccharide deacetylase family sporulation protein PdaB, partial [Priestia sp. SIMBA_032]